jgi:dihydrofolate synthase/folylpolyglutamate synthase
MKYEEAIKYIENIPKFTKKNTLEHTRIFLDELSINTNKMKIIHTAGTNGKGTVCAIIANVLKECGKSVGLFVSPHLVDINERIRINNEQITNEEFEEVFNNVKKTTDDLVAKGYLHPSFFEFLFLMGMYEFNKAGVEYVVLETGLGGRLDATNAIKNPFLTVITSVGLDHMEYLGNTVEKIAEEKAGIIKDNTPVIYWGEDERVAQVIEMKAKEHNAPAIRICKSNYKIIKKTDKSIAFSTFNEYYLNDTFLIPFIAEYQVQNTTIAIETISHIDDVRDRHIDIINGIKNVKWEGRMEIVSSGVIFDGAHNGPGIDEFIKTFEEYKCEGRKMILFSVVKDKDYEYMVSRLSQTDVDVIFVTHIDSDRGLNIEEIYKDFEKCGSGAKICINENAGKALDAALDERKEEDVLFCVGSLYLIGELKQAIKLRMNGD